MSLRLRYKTWRVSPNASATKPTISLTNRSLTPDHTMQPGRLSPNQTLTDTLSPTESLSQAQIHQRKTQPSYTLSHRQMYGAPDSFGNEPARRRNRARRERDITLPPTHISLLRVESPLRSLDPAPYKTRTYVFASVRSIEPRTSLAPLCHCCSLWKPYSNRSEAQRA